MGFIKIFSSMHITYFNQSYSSLFPSLVTLPSSSKQASLLLHGVCVCIRETGREINHNEFYYVVYMSINIFPVPLPSQR